MLVLKWLKINCLMLYSQKKKVFSVIEVPPFRPSLYLLVLTVAVYSYSRFISLVIKLTCYNSLEHLNHSHVAVPLYHIIKITSYYTVLYNKVVM